MEVSNLTSLRRRVIGENPIALTKISEKGGREDMKDMYFKKVLIKNCLIQLQKDIVDVVEFVKITGNQSQNEIIAETSDKISSLIEEDFKNVNDLFDDFFEEIEMDKQRRQRRRVLEKVFAT